MEPRPIADVIYGRASTAELRPEVRETHISLLFFVGDRVYKLKKPVHFGFIDLREAAAREVDCRREVDANRRLAPDVYLGVASVVDQDAHVEHLVVMKRLPASRSLASLIEQGVDASDELRQIAHVLATFHAAAPRSEAISAAATPRAIGQQWTALFEETNRFVGRLLDAEADAAIHRMVADYLGGRKALFDERISGGHVCDGHGDLQAADVFCLDDGPRILDCVEFDDRLRYVDVASDVAFLSMDLEQLGAPGRAGELVARYRELSHDDFPESLLHFYVAQRAYVRALVACLGHARDDVPAEAPAHLHRLALEHLERATVRLVVVGGLPGTGKSTVAEGVAEELGATLLRSDEVRQELEGRPSATAGAEVTEERYRPEATEAVYATMHDRARTALARGERVVVDASFWNETWRADFRRLAAESVSALSELVCECPPTEADARIRLRGRLGPALSEATPAVRAAMAERFARWPEAHVVDTSGTPGVSIASALDAVGQGGPGTLRRSVAGV